MGNSRHDAMKVVRMLESFRDPKNVKGMTRFGINTKGTLGVSMPVIRDLAKELNRDNSLRPDLHPLSLELWDTGIHEARILAALIDDPKAVTESQMEKWVSDFDSWDVCDQVCSNLFDKTEFAINKVSEWTKREEEFVKRAGFVLMASLAVHDKKANDKLFLSFLPAIIREATDERNFVKKAVNWALRQIGKRNIKLNKAAVAAAKKIQELESSTARWIAADALKELNGKAVQAKLSK